METWKPQLGAQLRLGHWSTRGLVAFYPFAKAGNLVDFSPYRNHGTISGAEWVGQGLQFVASQSDYAAASVPEHTPSAVTLICKFKTGASGTVRPLNYGDTSQLSVHYALDCEIGKDFTWWVRATSANYVYTAQKPAPNTWYVMAGTADGNNVALYIDGLRKLSQSQSQRPTNINTIGVGALVRQTIIYSDCEVEYVLVYDRALSAAEIQALYLDPWLPIRSQTNWGLFQTAGAAPSGFKPAWARHCNNLIGAT